MAWIASSSPSPLGTASLGLLATHDEPDDVHPILVGCLAFKADLRIDYERHATFFRTGSPTSRSTPR